MVTVSMCECLRDRYSRVVRPDLLDAIDAGNVRAFIRNSYMLGKSTAFGAVVLPQEWADDRSIVDVLLVDYERVAPVRIGQTHIPEVRRQ